jgi:hypothetical protein
MSWRGRCGRPHGADNTMHSLPALAEDNARHSKVWTCRQAARRGRGSAQDAGGAAADRHGGLPLLPRLCPGPSLRTCISALPPTRAAPLPLRWRWSVTCNTNARHRTISRKISHYLRGRYRGRYRTISRVSTHTLDIPARAPTCTHSPAPPPRRRHTHGGWRLGDRRHFDRFIQR